MKSGISENPFQLRPEETDAFYIIFDARLADGETLSNPVVTSEGVTVSNVEVNADPLDYEGVTYPAGTVVSMRLGGAQENNKSEVSCVVPTSAGRTIAQSLWVRGVKNYDPV